MKLFHGSNTIVKTIDFAMCKPYKVFGKGFYLTEIKQQAILMANRTANIFGGTPAVSVFEFNEEIAFNDTALSIKRFYEPNEEWALFVMNNRNRIKAQPFHKYDIVIGPVADDDIATLIRNFEDKIIDLPTLVNNLKYKKISSQYFFHSQKSLSYLKSL